MATHEASRNRVSHVTGLYLPSCHLGQITASVKEAGRETTRKETRIEPRKGTGTTGVVAAGKTGEGDQVAHAAPQGVTGETMRDETTDENEMMTDEKEQRENTRKEMTATMIVNAPPRQDEPPVPKNSLAKFFESVEPPVTSDKQGNEAKDETIVEEGEEMDAVNDDDAGMMAAMGMGGFGSTKGKHVAGNQEGGVDIKKIRTWRQYMNRRGGFNRPLDKIK
ncbi:hypothetical protein M378DRAFT_893492 [Amanita muscaria Koide BX008]|uniref:U4/U6.U5 small nuclear ribonucleoprotein 27kDa protein domain-containing protein n=1 Tax=Amanita muscaria (strain Koide BX008) TaxID=946122 RepID=A0A0C2X378_AMAMK|nr:hypothetical protein M378DRAFT_893492 [Amanita muscaria Koide BX008]